MRSHDCGCTSSTPNLKGTEVTILSGHHKPDSPRSNPTGETSKGAHLVIGSAIAIAVIAYFVKK